MTTLYILVIFYVLYLVVNLGNLANRVRIQFENAELNWSFSHEWICAGLAHAVAEIIVFLILAVPATIHCIINLPSVFQEVYNEHKLQPRE